MFSINNNTINTLSLNSELFNIGEQLSDNKLATLKLINCNLLSKLSVGFLTLRKMQILMVSIKSITDGTIMMMVVGIFFLSIPEKTKSIM